MDVNWSPSLLFLIILGLFFYCLCPRNAGHVDPPNVSKFDHVGGLRVLDGSLQGAILGRAPRGSQGGPGRSLGVVPEGPGRCPEGFRRGSRGRLRVKLPTFSGGPPNSTLWGRSWGCPRGGSWGKFPALWGARFVSRVRGRFERPLGTDFEAVLGPKSFPKKLPGRLPK